MLRKRFTNRPRRKTNLPHRLEGGMRLTKQLATGTGRFTITILRTPDNTSQDGNEEPNGYLTSDT